MMTWIIAYIAAGVAFVALDGVYVRWAAESLYRPVVGDILAEEFRKGAAAAFYFIYISGMLWFAVRPGVEEGSVATALLNGALLGGLCYATFDLTCQAVMKAWSTRVSVIDIAWGAAATALASGAACWAALRLG